MAQNYNHNQALKVLEVSAGISQKDLKIKWKKLMRIFHPDCQRAEQKEFYERKTRLINEAYQFLKKNGTIPPLKRQTSQRSKATSQFYNQPYKSNSSQRRSHKKRHFWNFHQWQLNNEEKEFCLRVQSDCLTKPYHNIEKERKFWKFRRYFEVAYQFSTLCRYKRPKNRIEYIESWQKTFNYWVIKEDVTILHYMLNIYPNLQDKILTNGLIEAIKKNRPISIRFLVNGGATLINDSVNLFEKLQLNQPKQKKVVKRLIRADKKYVKRKNLELHNNRFYCIMGASTVTIMTNFFIGLNTPYIFLFAATIVLWFIDYPLIDYQAYKRVVQYKADSESTLTISKLLASPFRISLKAIYNFKQTVVENLTK